MVTAGTPLTGSQFDFGMSGGNKSLSQSQHSHNESQKNSAMADIEEHSEVSHMEENMNQQTKTSQDLRTESKNGLHEHNLSDLSQKIPPMKRSEDFASMSASNGLQNNSQGSRNPNYAAPSQSQVRMW